MQRSPRTRFAAASIALVATITFAACGDDDDDDTTGTDAPAPTEVTDGPVTTEVPDTGGDMATTGDLTDDTTADTFPDEVGEREDYVAALSTEIENVDADFAACLADAVLSDEVYADIQANEVTIRQFVEEGPSVLSLDEGAIDQIASSMADCGELAELIPTIGDDERACVQEHMTNEQVATVLATQVLGFDLSDELDEANDAVEECIDELRSETTSS
jgi:hypothetical protein